MVDQSWSRLFGYDVFISFALGPPPRGSRSYASDLARRLRERGFTVFFSEDDAPAGGELNLSLRRALAASRVLVVVANRSTLREPRWVRSEVEEFRRRNPRRSIVPISIDGALQDPEVGAATEPWLPFGQRIWIDESREAGESGTVSDAVIDRLVTAPRAVRSTVRLRAAVGAVLLFFAALAAFALWQKQASDANAAEAVRQGGVAKSQALRADAAASEARAAASAAEAAREQERQARLAEQRQRELAEQQLRIAQSRESAANASAQLAADPERSMLLARQGLERWPTPESQRALRAALLEPIGHRLVDSAVGPVWDLAYTPEGGRLLAAGEGGWLVAPSAVAAASAAGRASTKGTPAATATGAPMPEPPRVRAISVSADGRWAVFANQAFDSQLWSLAGAAPAAWTPAPVPAPGATFRRVALSPDARLAATFGVDACVRLWAVAGSAPMAELCAGQSPVRSVSFSGDGGQFVSAAQDGAARVWDVKAGRVVHEFPRSFPGIARAVFSNDGLLAAIVDRAASGVQLWNTRAWKPAATCQTNSAVVDVAFSPDSQQLAMVNALGFDLPVCNTSDGKERFLLQGHTATLFSAAFSPDSTLLVTASADKTARVWDARGGFPVTSLRGHRDVVTRARFSPDGQRIATASLDGTVREWEHLSFTDVVELQTEGSGIDSAGLSVDGRRAWLVNRRGDVFVLSLAERTLQRLPSAPGRIAHLALAADGASLVKATTDGVIRRLKVPEGTVLAQWQAPQGPVRRLVLSRDGKRLISLGDAALLWDIERGVVLARLGAGAAAPRDASFSPDGRTIVVLHGDMATLWEGRRGQRLSVLRGTPGFEMASAQFSADGQSVVTAGIDKIVRLWKVPSAIPVRAFTGHTDGVIGAWPSRSGERIVTIAQDRTARVWDTATAQPISELRGRSDNWSAAAFDAQGTLVLTSGGHNPVTVWDASTGSRLIELNGGASLAALSADGQHILVVANGRARMVRCTACGDAAQLLQRARALAHASQELPRHTSLTTARPTAAISRLPK